jgi:hypothetical protein
MRIEMRTRAQRRRRTRCYHAAMASGLADGGTLSKPGDAMTSERQTIRLCIGALCAVSLLVACAEEPPPRSANEFMENAILLEATMVRCAENRAEARYDPECINAREAVNRLAAAREQAKRQDLEAQSERKRQALRRAQEAAAEARRRAREAEERRRDAELHGVFEPLPDERSDEDGIDQAARPLSSPAGTPETHSPSDVGSDSSEGRSTTTALPAASSDRLPESVPPTVVPPETPESSDLEAIRRELERRQDESAEQ